MIKMRYLKNEKSQLIMWLRVIGVLKNNQKTQVVLMTFKTYFELEMHDKNKLEWSHKTLYTHSVFQHCQRLMSIFLSRSFLGCFTRKRRKLLEANDLLHVTNVATFRVS